MSVTSRLSGFLRRRWKFVLNLVTATAMLALIIAIRSQLFETFRNLFNVNAWVLLLLIPNEVLNYHAQTKMYQHLFKLVGNKLSYKYLFRAALELNFVNHVFPSGGVTGISYFSLRLRKHGEISAGKATIVQIMKLVLVFMSIEGLVVGGTVILAAVGRVNQLLIMLVSTITTLAVITTLLMFFVVGSRRRINVTFALVTQMANRLLQIIRPKHPETINMERAHGWFNEFHDNFQIMRRNWRELRAPFGYACLANITEIAAVYIVYVAFGHAVNVGAVILAYTVANFAGLVSVMPGGVGIYEALMTAVMASAGVPAAVSLPAVVMYRVLSTVLQIPPGYYLYHKTVQSGEATLTNRSHKKRGSNEA